VAAINEVRLVYSDAVSCRGLAALKYRSAKPVNFHELPYGILRHEVLMALPGRSIGHVIIAFWVMSFHIARAQRSYRELYYRVLRPTCAFQGTGA